MTADSWDVIVAGGGPAGLSAALMLGRSRRRVLVVDAGSPRNRFAARVHGVLGQEGVPPGELLDRARAEVEGYGVELVDGAVERVEREQGGLRITTTDGTVRSARALVVATGLSDELPEIPGIAERWGVTVLHCPYCHGWEVRDQRLAVLVTSPLGLHQAELIRQWSDRVTVLTGGIGPLGPETEQRLRARGIGVEPEPVAEILGEGPAIDAVRLRDGREVAVDAIFTAGAPRPHDGFLAALGLDRSETPFGSFLAVDDTGRTSDDRVWAIGNVVSPMANVPMSIGAGAFTGGAVNGALVTWDVEAALRDAMAWPQVTSADFWEERYAGSDRVWSGRVNQALADIAGTLSPRRALDLGCGEGADVIWLAQHGWEATGIDISPTAVRRAAAAAEQAGQNPGHARFLAADLSAVPAGAYDLVSASFLHSPAERPREEILREASERVARGGHLLITSHAAPPPWADAPDGHEHHFLDPAEELEQLALDPSTWDVILAETRPREAISPDGEPATLDDVVVLVRRR
ncbi:Methyltransferase type 11 [Nostocoides japonicum T1-X7]|uniref:Methyltransferase type 11 n=1 Tax=Nostocoides japonicum T1-X7 TaxID=1194083 RepID=A0A077M1H9_9MICO|nr:FAD-dependent oxidoreductase [Tetrasphaera japonica]CCH78075.1 Methyltransferase type 11 [Tetrasphaera japonica T1-X7]